MAAPSLRVFKNIFQHEKRNLLCPSDQVILFLLFKILTIRYEVYGNFLKIFDHFPKVSEDSLKVFRRQDERFQTFFEHFPKMKSHVWDIVFTNLLPLGILLSFIQ